MKFAILGWSYKKTPIEIREHLALSQNQKSLLARDLSSKFSLDEVLILSTCNRTEFYFRVSQPSHIAQELLKYLIEFWGTPELKRLSYTFCDLEAVQHLFRVASSLDSMVIGEPQILGQVKDAYQQFLEEKFLGSLFNSLFPKAFSSAKRIRTETQIANFAVSISFAAVELAKRIFSDLHNKTIMVIGAGEMAELAVKHLIRNGVTRILITNRTFANAVVMAEKYQGSAVQFEQLGDYLPNADIVIASTGASQCIVTQEMVRKCLKKRKGNPMFFIDIAVPRDIEASVNDLSNVYCYDIDDLQNVVDKNLKDREHEAQTAEKIVEEDVIKTHSWFKTQSTIPTLRALRSQFHGIGEDEFEQMSRKLKDLSPEQEENVKHLIHRIIHKLLHTPSCNLKSLSNRDDVHLHLESLNELFGLTPTEVSLKNISKEPSLKLLHGRAQSK